MWKQSGLIFQNTSEGGAGIIWATRARSPGVGAGSQAWLEADGSRSLDFSFPGFCSSCSHCQGAPLALHDCHPHPSAPSSDATSSSTTFHDFPAEGSLCPPHSYNYSFALLPPSLVLGFGGELSSPIFQMLSPCFTDLCLKWQIGERGVELPLLHLWEKDD